MGVFTWIIFGLITGVLAKFIFPGKENMGWLWTIILGIVGAYIGGFIGKLLGFGDITGFNFKSMLLAIVGGLIILFIYGKLTKSNQ